MVSLIAHRSSLSVPAGDERKLVRALACAADELILDLEDSVAPGNKVEARAALCARSWGEVRQDLTVRINAPRSPWCHDDLVALAAADLPFTTVLVPKVDSAGDLAFVERLLDGAEAAAGRRDPIGVCALIESAAAIRALDEIATASTRLTRLVIGYADLAASMGRTGTVSWAYQQEAVLTAARGAGLIVTDGPYLGVEDGEEFRAAVDDAAARGFDGKWVIHPRQVDHVNARFTPSLDEVHHAQRIVAALDDAHATGRGAVALNGAMIDEALAVAARRVLERSGRSTR